MKILYNVTVSIDESIEREWKQWMIDHHIPDVMSTELFESYQMQKIISGEHENGVTYAIQYLAPSMDHLKTYQDDHALRLQTDHHSRYKDRYAAFRTIMEVVSQG